MDQEKELSEEYFIEGNNLFAQFLGWKLDGSFYHINQFLISPLTGNSRAFHYEQLGFHLSYDWIMLVWKKFRSLNWYNQDYCSAYSHRHRYFVFIVSSKIVNHSIEDIFHELVEAIKWYNTTKKQIKEFQIDIFPSDMKSDEYGKSIFIATGFEKLYYGEPSIQSVNFYNICILSDDEIKENDYGINLASGSLFKLIKKHDDQKYWDVEFITGSEGYGNIGSFIRTDKSSWAIPKKIIACSNKNIITNNVIPDSFINEFVEKYNSNNKIEKAQLEIVDNKITKYDYIKSNN